MFPFLLEFITWVSFMLGSWYLVCFFRGRPRAFREGEVLWHIQDFREKFWSKFWISLYILYIFTSPSAQDREVSQLREAFSLKLPSKMTPATYSDLNHQLCARVAPLSCPGIGLGAKMYYRSDWAFRNTNVVVENYASRCCCHMSEDQRGGGGGGGLFV